MMTNLYWTLIFISINIGYIWTETTDGDMFLKRYPVPADTPASIDIISSQVKQVVLSPITFVISATKILEAENTGKAVELRPANIDDVASVTGGPYGKDFYNFHLIKIFWSNNTSGPASTTVDGKGAPVLLQALFYNIKYHSFENALQYPNGIAQINHQATVGNILGLSFVPMAAALKRIRKAHTKTNITTFSAIIWFEYLLLDVPYYTYPGSYTDDDTGKTYDCTIVVQYPPRPPFIISPKQFDETFLSLENEEGRPYNNAQTPQTTTTPVAQSVGTFQILTL